jgi:steroid delta-isomerase-like uncharacterized protein
MITKLVLSAGMLAAAMLPSAAQADSVQDANARQFLQFVEAVINRGEVNAADRFFAPDLIDHAPWPGHSADVAGFKAGLAEMRTGFPDLRMTLERTIAQGDLLVAQMKISGSHLGDFMGQKASGKTFEIDAIDIVRMNEGRIAEHWGLIDTAAMAGQLGL